MKVFPIAIFSGKSMAHFLDHWSRWWSCGISHSMYDISTTNLSRVPEKTSGRFGRWPEGKLWLCLVQVGGFKCLLQAWTCSTRELFPWWSQQGNRFQGLLFSKLGPQVLWLMTHDPVYFWEFFASESERIPVVNFKCRRFTYSCLENEVWSLASLNVFWNLHLRTHCSLASMVLDRIPTQSFQLAILQTCSSRVSTWNLCF